MAKEIDLTNVKDASEAYRRIQEPIKMMLEDKLNAKAYDALTTAQYVYAPMDTGNLRSTIKLNIQTHAGKRFSDDKFVYTFSVSAYDFDEEVAYGKLHELVADNVYRYHTPGTMNQYLIRAINRHFGTHFEHYTSPWGGL